MPDYLSVAIHVTGDDSSFLATIAKDTALLKTFAKQDPKVLLGADGAPLTSDLATASGELNSWSKSQVNKKIGIDTLQMQRNIFAANETLSAWAGVAIVKDIDLDIKTAAAMASLDATIASLKAEALLNPITVPIKTDGAGTSALAAAVAKFFTIHTGGLGGVAVTGALGAGLDLAGMSVAHLVVAGMDLAGSAVAGLAGGLLKGLAGGGVAAVGIGTDLAGIGQAAGDIKLINSDTQALNQAVAIYGKNSYQAADAQKQLNDDLSSFAAVARGPVQKAVAALAQFVVLFDKFTGPAEAKGANLITQAIKAAEAFLPIIGKFASINMSKITTGLQPFFKWLDSPAKGGGLQIFTELEKIFTQHLPTGLSVFVNGFESLVKVIGIVAPKTGGFMAALNNFFTSLNKQLSNPQSKDVGHINNLLTSWNVFYGFLKQASKDLVGLFSGGKDQKTGQSMFKELTGFLQEIGKWEQSSSGTASITRFFKASKGELTTFLNILPPLAKALGALIGLVAPGMHLGMTTAIKALTGLLNVLASTLTAVAKIPGLGKIVSDIAGFAGAALGIGLIASKLKILTPAIDGLLGVLVKANIPGVSSLASKALGSPNTTFSTSVTEFSAAVTRFVGGAAAGAGEAGVAAKGASKLGSTIGTLAVTSLVVYGAFEAKAPVTAAVNKVSSTLFGTVSTSAQAQAGYNASIKAAQGNAAKIAIINQEATTAAKAFGFTIVEVSTQTAKKTTAAYTKAGSDAAAGFTTGITSGKANAGKASSDIGLNALNSLKTTLKAKSPSQEMAIIGGDAALGFANGMTSSSSLAKFRTAGTDIADAIAEGIKRGESAITVALQQVVTKAINQALQQSSKASLTAVRAGAGTVF